MRVAVITPVRNAQSRIADTVRSVLDQHAPTSSPKVEILYVIQDGASDDGTRAAIDRTAAEHPTTRVRVLVDSQPDGGMYDALARGFTRVEAEGGADWYCYLNAGDLWDPECTHTLSLVDRHTDAAWLCGMHTYYGPTGAIVHTRLPFRYRQDLLRAGAYGRGLPTVQQESTFWRHSLHTTVDWSRVPTFRVAGDAFLWWTFAARMEPTILQASLAGFRYHGGHLGVDKDEYRREIDNFAGPLSVTTRALIASQIPLWEQPTRLKARLNPHLFTFSTTKGGWTSQRGSIPATADD